MERIIAIDNVCAWPNLTLLPDGDIIATIFNQPVHGRWEGDVECWASTDGGRFWSLRGVPAPHEPGTNRMNVAAGLANNGDLIVISSGWSDRPPVGTEKMFQDAHTLVPWVSRSADGGKTWSRTETFPFERDGKHAVPFGDIVRFSDGSLGVTCYRGGTFFVKSRDDGKTWEDVSPMADFTNETDLLLFDDQHLIAAGRSTPGGYLTLLRSADGGTTWQSDGPVTGPNMHPAHLLKLDTGKVLLTYGIRHRGFYAIGIRMSEDDEGKKWYSPGVLVTLDDAFDGGYPATVQLEDGTLVTAYYASGVAVHERYHMGVVRWQREEPWERNQPKPQTHE